MTSSGPAMTASLKKAIDKKDWIVVTGWTPHWMFDRFKLKVLQDPKLIYGNTESIHTIAWKGFSEKDPFAAELLGNIRGRGADNGKTGCPSMDGRTSGTGEQLDS